MDQSPMIYLMMGLFVFHVLLACCFAKKRKKLGYDSENCVPPGNVTTNTNPPTLTTNTSLQTPVLVTWNQGKSTNVPYHATAPYPSTEAPYPTEEAPNPPTVPPYPTAGPSHPTAEPPYPTAGASPPTAEPPYPTAGPSHPTAGPPYPMPGSSYASAPYPPNETGIFGPTPPGWRPLDDNTYEAPPPSYEQAVKQAPYNLN